MSLITDSDIFYELDLLTEGPEWQNLIARKAQEHWQENVIKKAKSWVQVQEAIDQIQTQRKRTPFLFVTVNPKPTITYEDFHHTTSSIFSHEDISQKLWSYETRSEGPNPGLHLHALLCVPNVPHDSNWVERKIKKRFLNLVGNRKHIHVRYVTKDEVPNVISYIKKDKVSSSKKKSHAATLLWRKDNNIPEVLGEITLTCL